MQVPPRLNLIYARAANGVIGCNNTIPWHLPEDLAHFKRLTLGCPVIMGRKTWDSLPARFRPLPGRRNIVLTRNLDWQGPGAECATDLPAAIALCPEGSEVWVIGGAQIYAQALPLAQRVVATEIAQAFDGDAFAPALDGSWQECSRDAQIASSGLAFAFVCYTKRNAPDQP
ncbi:MAG: hypothetical protein RLZZ352_490 [Pseudomonadota bacterium]|jgi:dihydrofolate reductase